MARISLKEAYDNRDVIAWLVKHEDEINELMDILKDINPSGDLTNIVTKTGDQTIDGIKTFIGKIVADCDIIQNGGNYETHAEQVFTTNDYIVMRDGAVSGLGTGQFSGFQVKKYNGSDDGRLVIDNAGVARVGDIGDEQPLATRDEASDMTSGALVKWDGVNQKMIAPASNVGSDSRPVKVVNGEIIAVSDDLVEAAISEGIATVNTNATIHDGHNVVYRTRGGVTIVSFDVQIADNADTQGTYKSFTIASGLPPSKIPTGSFLAISGNMGVISVDGEVGNPGWCYVGTDGTLRIFVRQVALNNKIVLGSVMYFSE